MIPHEEAGDPRFAVLCGCSACDMCSGSWQVNGYVVNLFWAFDTHKQEKRTLNFRGSILSHKGNTCELICATGKSRLDQCFLALEVGGGVCVEGSLGHHLGAE